MLGNFLSQILQSATSLAKSSLPDQAAMAEEWSTANEIADEREGTRLTKRAQEMRQRLRNPYFDKTHAAKAASVARKNREKVTKKAAADVSRALASVALLMQSERQVEDLSREGELLAPSRKQHLSWDHQSLEVFAQEMNERGVPASALGRLRENEFDLVAKIIRYSVDDPEGLDPDSPVFKLARCGELDAMRQNMTDDEAKLMAEVDEWRIEPEWFGLREALEKRIGRPLDILPSFAASMEKLARSTDSLSKMEFENLWVSRGRAFELQGKQLAQILDSPDQNPKSLAVLVSCLRDGISWTDEQYTVSLVYKTLQSIVDDVERHDVPPAWWLQEIMLDLQRFESEAASNLSRPQQFYAILSHVLIKSQEMHKYYDNRADTASFDGIMAPRPKHYAEAGEINFEDEAVPSHTDRTGLCSTFVDPDIATSSNGRELVPFTANTATHPTPESGWDEPGETSPETQHTRRQEDFE